ncbi:hypothetical protein [Streptomyces sp. CBMA29]|uniref:hypothetical protein n=1 Tax=Streptomyces sp. CBMA29 TaxID=1896314 RepID=UPI001661EA96|nr:hypothetical protein [Streptomyces sp. CBMA29]
MLTPIRSRPSRRAAGAVLALAGALAGCGGGAGPSQDPPKPPFGWSPSGPSQTPPTWGETTGAAATRGTGSPSAGSTFALTAPPERAGATPVTPSASGSVSTCPTPGQPYRLCGRYQLVWPTIDPSAPCVDRDQGVHAGATYACVHGYWVELPKVPTPATPK